MVRSALFSLLLGTALVGPLIVAPVMAQTDSQPVTGQPTVEPTAEQTADQLRQDALAMVYSSNVVTPAAEEGLRRLEAAAEAGDVKADIEVGKLFLYGTMFPEDWARARRHFDRAAEKGDHAGLADYGMMMMWREKGWKEAQTLLEQAAQNGVPSAWVTLAEGAMYGYLGGGEHSRAKFEGYAEKARAAGQDRIAVLEADRMLWGISVPASGKAALQHLTAAADAGNAEAARRLIALMRRGNDWNVPNDNAGARAALEKYAPLFAEEDQWRIATAIQAAAQRTPEALAQLRQTVDARPELVNRGFAADLVDANRNAAISLLQARLNAAGHEAGPTDGLAGPATLRAMNAACVKLLQPARCADSVLRNDVIADLIAALG